MKCHDCQTKTKVEETRVLPENPRWTKRRRVCKNCGFTLWTVEMPAEDVVVKEVRFGQAALRIRARGET
jgi:transcriptional regulator NrdR family protein